jgi:hypothetical protein
MVDCDEHHIDHPKNFQPVDVEMRKCILYHNKELFKGGRNYRSNVVILAGFKCKCNKCRKKIQDHFAHHHVLHNNNNLYPGQYIIHKQYCRHRFLQSLGPING